MGRNLAEMTLEELWQLFPIQLVPFSPQWRAQYENERARLAAELTERVKIHHIGSTAIGGIYAKPIVDILVETDADGFDAVDEVLKRLGYTCMNVEPTCRDYNLGYTPDGFAEKVFHLHLRVFGDNDELYFRDYMAQHPEKAKEYERLKLSLLKKYEHNRDGYTQAKGCFIREMTAAAKAEYANRY